MARRELLGPVFALEWTLQSRRPMFYAIRAGFIALLLCGLYLVWVSEARNRQVSFRQYAELGATFSRVVLWIQFALVLLVAPAATAGAFCQDRARGMLSHLLLTDLSNREIVLGKLAGGLVPLVGLMASGLPVTAFTSLLGGIDPRMVTGGFLVTFGVGVLATALALTISLRASKVHEVLLATYFLLLAWTFAAAVWEMLGGIFWWGGWMPPWMVASNPIVMTDLSFRSQADLARMGLSGLFDQVLFTFGCLGVAALLVGWTITSLRQVEASRGAVTQPRPRRRATAAAAAGAADEPRPWRLTWPGATLDRQPVLWYELRKQRPTRLGRLLDGAFVVLGLGLVALSGVSFVVTIQTGNRFRMYREPIAMCCGGLVAIGLIRVGIQAATTLAEERVRGSLDILRATTLTTFEIVSGKWLGTYRTVVLLACLPALVVLFLAENLAWGIGAPLLLGMDILAYGAFLTSLGMAVALWTSRLGRAIGVTIAAHVAVTIGAIALTVTLTSGPGPWAYLPISASPLWVVAFVSFLASGEHEPDFAFQILWTICWSAVYASLALLIARQVWIRMENARD